MRSSPVVKSFLVLLALFESMRLLGWGLLLQELSEGRAVAERSNEFFALAHLGGFYLGFPYSWPVVLVLDFFGLLPEDPLSVGLVYAVVWLLGSVALLMLIFRAHARRT